MKNQFSLLVLSFLLVQAPMLSAQSFYSIDFIENKGQWKEDFQYKSTIGNGSVFIQSQGYTILKNNPADYNTVLEYMHGHTKHAKAPVEINAGLVCLRELCAVVPRH